jgi:hypothetical protein
MHRRSERHNRVQAGMLGMGGGVGEWFSPLQDTNCCQVPSVSTTVERRKCNAHSAKINTPGIGESTPWLLIEVKVHC